MDSNSTLGDLAFQVIDHINPGETPRTLFHHYSLPNFDAGKRPQLESGMSIKSGKLRVADGTVLLSKLNPGSPKVWRIPKAMSQHAIASTEFLVLQPRTGITLNALYAACLNPSFLRSVAAKATGTSSSHQRVRPSDLLATNLNLGVANADLAQIGDFISALDDKIELNRRMNATLESMARALFQSWFVDFDPVRAKAEGRQPVGMDAETAALFPDSFEDSVLGPIPMGWETPRISEVTKVGIGRTPPRLESHWFSHRSTDIPWMSIRDLGSSAIFIRETNEYLVSEAVTQFRIPVIPPNTVVLSFKLTIGRVAITADPMLSNEAIAHFIIEKNSTNLSAEYIFFYLKCFDFGQLGNTSSIATAINSEIVRGIRMLLPKKRVMAEFNARIKSILAQTKNLESETRTLEGVRDILLPMLLSGELRLGDVAA